MTNKSKLPTPPPESDEFVPASLLSSPRSSSRISSARSIQRRTTTDRVPRCKRTRDWPLLCTNKRRFYRGSMRSLCPSRTTNASRNVSETCLINYTNSTANTASRRSTRRNSTAPSTSTGAVPSCHDASTLSESPTIANNTVIPLGLYTPFLPILLLQFEIDQKGRGQQHLLSPSSLRVSSIHSSGLRALRSVGSPKVLAAR